MTDDPAASVGLEIIDGMRVYEPDGEVLKQYLAEPRRVCRRLQLPNRMEPS
ncbi:hypothetical protein GGD83_004930 [Rhodoblastus sphagnicola]|nr:hypothetical protein [Rhodoblastus sphagnicola]